MKVLVVSHAWPPEGRGGTERYAAAAAAGLAARGHDVRVFTGSLEWREERARVAVTHAGLPVTRVHRDDLYFDHWDKIPNPHVAAWFEAELQGFAPDVVHLHHWIRLGLDLASRAAARGVPVLGHLHDLFLTCPRVFRVRRDGADCTEPLGAAPCLPCVPRWSFQDDAEIQASLGHYTAQVRAEAAAATRWLAPSAAHRDLLAALLPELAGRSFVLPHPRLEEPWPAARAAGSPAGSLRVLFFSELHPVKGLHVVLEALQELGPGSGVELDVYGEPVSAEYRAELERRAAGLAVRFHGAYARGEPLARPADLVVLPFQARESYSFLLDEALDSGLPLLVSDRGPLSERAGGRARVVAAADPAAWAAALHELAAAPALRSALAAAPVAPPEDREAHLDRLEEHLAAVVREGARPVAAPPRPADLAFEWDRRERAFRELLRGEGWEKEIGRLQDEVERLRTKGDGGPAGEQG